MTGDFSSPTRVVIADDNATLREAVQVWLSQSGAVEVVGMARDGHEAVELALRERPDVVLMDVEMPGMDGAEATQALTEALPSCRVIAHTGYVSSEAVTRMIVAGAVGYVVKGAHPERLARAVQAAASGRIQLDPQAFAGLFEGILQLAREETRRRRDSERLHEQLEESYRETVRALAAALDKRDEETQDHVCRVTERAVAVGKRLGLHGQALCDLEYGATFHDVGKIGIPDSILLSPNPLTDDEWEVIKQHTIYGEQIIRPIKFLRDVACIVRHSHERWDGTGYPDQLKGEEIPLASRIVLVCDAFDVMTSGRKYQKALSEAVAMARMRRDVGRHFDGAVVEALAWVLREEREDVPVWLASRKA